MPDNDQTGSKNNKRQMSYPPKEIIWNFLSVVAGVMTSIGVFYFLFLATALLPQALNSTAFLMILLGFAAFAGGFSTAAMATRQKFILAMITSFVLVIVFINFFDATFNYRNSPDEILQVIIIFLLSDIGGIAGTLPSRKTSKNHEDSSPGSASV